MVHRELSASDLDSALLLDLVQAEDPLGYLSVYVRITPTGAARRPEIELRNELAELERGTGGNGSLLRAEALRWTLELIAPQLERLVDARSGGRGRALFASLSSSRVTCLATPLPVSATQVVLDARPFVHPLLELMDEGCGAGVALLATREAQLLDWRLGELRRVARVTADTAGPRSERPGPVVSMAMRAQQITPLRERRARRERERRSRWTEEVAAQAMRFADEHAWERLLVCGDERLTGPLLDALPNRLAAIALVDPRQLGDHDRPAVAAAVARALGRDRARRHAGLVRRVRDAALGGGRGALGLSEVTAALNDARAEHVVYDPGLSYRGAVAAGGALFAAGEAPGLAEPEPRLLERVVERALLTDARITPLAGPAARELADVGGVAALLRW